jgi:hypothetical protein
MNGEKPTATLQMNLLSLRNNQLRFKTSGKLLDLSQRVCVTIRSYRVLQLFNEIVMFYGSKSCMLLNASEQPIELPSVTIELMSKKLSHCVIPNTNTHH